MPRRESIEIQLRADVRSLQSQLKKAEAYNKSFAATAKRQMAGANKAYASVRRSILGVAGAYLSFRGVTSVFSKIIENTGRQQEAEKLLEAQTIKLGSAIDANLIKKYAALRQQITKFGDEATIAAAAVLSAYTNINDQQVFENILTTAQDIATVTGRDLVSVVRTLGQAFNDPVAALGRLTQAGISVNKQKQELIKTLFKEGKIVESHKVLYEEISKAYNDTAVAAGKTLSGALARVVNNWNDLFEASEDQTGALQMRLHELADFLASPEFVEKTSGWLDSIIDGSVDAIKGLEKMAEAVTKFGDEVEAVAKGAGATALLRLFGLPGAIAGTVGAAAGIASYLLPDIKEPEPFKSQLPIRKLQAVDPLESMIPETNIAPEAADAIRGAGYDLTGPDKIREATAALKEYKTSTTETTNAEMKLTEAKNTQAEAYAKIAEARKQQQQEQQIAVNEVFREFRNEAIDMEQLAAAYEEGADAVQQFNLEKKIENALAGQGVILTEQQKNQLIEYGNQALVAAEKIKSIQAAEARLKEVSQAVARSFGDAFTSLILGTQSVKEAFANMARSIIAQLLEILIVRQLVEGIAGSITSAFSGLGGGTGSGAGFGGGYGGAGGGPGIPGAATGGTFGAGDYAVVGEKGPELVRFNAPSQVFSNQDSMNMMGGGGTIINQTFNVNVQDNDELRQEMQLISTSAASQASQALLARIGKDGQVRKRVRG